MKYGYFNVNFDSCSYPETAVKVAKAAEAAGFESIWVGERLLAPDPRAGGSPVEPTDRMLDPIVALSFLAAHTSKVKLGTGVVVLPQRQPMVFAKALASLDVLSGGRLILGIGAGYLEQELNGTGAKLSERGARTDEYLAAMRQIWTQDGSSFDGRFVQFNAVSAYPHPTHEIPIVVGGTSDAALKRAVTSCHGWFGFGMDVEETARMVGRIREIAARVERPAALGPLEITISNRGRVDKDLAARYAEAGVDRLILLARRYADEESLLRYVDNVAESLLTE